LVTGKINQRRRHLEYTGSHIKIIILPPWYRSWWAWLLYISIASALIYGVLQVQGQAVKAGV
jgi:hypothetical protein